jgi:hypothetical protein
VFLWLRRRSADDEINRSFAAPLAPQSTRPINHRLIDAVSRNLPGNIRFALVAAGFAPHDDAHLSGERLA